MINYKSYFSAILLSIIFISCGVDTSSNAKADSRTKIAYFYDSAVNGVQYKCGSIIQGITGDVDNQNGSFRYRDNCVVTFSLGKVNLGKIHGNDIVKNSKVYPTNIVNAITTDSNNQKAVNILRFLQTLDDDNNSLNGINITNNVLNKLQLNTTNSLDLSSSNLNDNIIQDAINSTDTNKVLLSKTRAIAHFEYTLRKYVDSNIDTVPPYQPYLTNNITSINNQHTKDIDFEVNGENGSKIFVAFNSDGNETNLTFADRNIVISNQKAILNLDFDNINISYFHYFIMIQDSKEHNSTYLHLKVLKDYIPPSVSNNRIILNILERQTFIQNIDATDQFDINYKIITAQEDNESIDHSLFTIDTNGSVTFITPPDYDINIGRIYKVVARASDEANNTSDVLISISLSNILDNPPTLTNTVFSTNLLEELTNGAYVYDANITLENNLTIAPDNDANLTSFYYKLNSHTNLFDINYTTGKLNIKDITNDLFDFEKGLNVIDLNISVENNNTTTDGNITYFNLTVNIINKIDTNPKLIVPPALNLNEHDLPGRINLFTIQKDTNLSDKNLTMTYSIENGNDGNFSINSTTGELSHVGDNLDFELTSQYNLTIRATNSWHNASTHFDDINFSINIINVIDQAPKIKYITQINTIPESTDINFIIANIDTNGTTLDQNTTISYSLSGSTPFKIDSDGIIRTSRQLLNDYAETLQNNSVTSFSFTINATNRWWDGTLNNSNTLNYNINITNVIDNAPSLANPNSTLSFEENTSTPISTVIYQVLKDAATFDKNTTTSYSITSGNTGNSFDINTSNGEITLSNLLDWEVARTYALNINAQNIWWDGSTNTSNNIVLNIDVNNTIEKPPRISIPSTIYVHENIDVNDIIAFIETNSTEKDEQTITSFSIASGNDGNFSIVTTPIFDSFKQRYYSELSMASKIDFETNSSYTLDINASNSFGSSTQSVNINVIDDVDTDLPFVVIAISYADINISTDEASFETLFFTPQAGKPRLSQYFETVSKGKFTILKANETNGIVNNGIMKVNLFDRNHTSSPTQLLEDIRNAISISAVSDINFSGYDTNNDGNITNNELQFVFLIAGGEETYNEYNISHNADANLSITSANGTFEELAIITSTPITLNTKTINSNYFVIGELIGSKETTLGLIAKTISQKLLGFKKGNSGFKFNEFDLMGKGFLGTDTNNTIGYKPVHPSIFNKTRQGWITPKLLRRGFNHDIDLFNTHDNLDKFNSFRINDLNSSVYYLLENRNYTILGEAGNKVNYDNSFKSLLQGFDGGIVAWRIDLTNLEIKAETIDNSNTNNIFRPQNATSDIDPSLPFAFFDTGSIEDDNLINGSKVYRIQLIVK